MKKERFSSASREQNDVNNIWLSYKPSSVDHYRVKKHEVGTALTKAVRSATSYALAADYVIKVRNPV